MQFTANSLFAWISDPVVLLVFGIVFATLVVHFVARRLFDRLERRTEQTEMVWDDALVRAVRGPLTMLVWVLGFAWAAQIISKQTNTGVAQIIDPARYVAVVALLALFLVRFIREVENGLIADGADITTVQAIGKLLRVSVIITASLSVLQTLGVSISGILAFGGIGGIAVGFAARDLLANFFGGLTLYLDRPFVVGEWIRSPDRTIEGTVESIGWRLTCIRTFDQRPLYVPNSVFSTVAIENPSRMRNRRIYEVIGVRYDDADKVKTIVDQVHAMLLADPDIESENQTLMVNFTAFNASSLDFMVYAFTHTTDWATFNNIKQRILLSIYDIVDRQGAEIAFPTSTVHLASVPPAAEPGR